MKFFLIALTTLVSLANCQISPVYTSLCPSGIFNDQYSYDFISKSFPITGLIGTLANYSPNGMYKVTTANGADQCCYNCNTQTNYQCSSWTYDGCGNCYLTSYYESYNYLTIKTNDPVEKQLCPGFSSGFGPKTLGITDTTTTTTGDLTFKSQCQIARDQYPAVSSSSPDTQTTATSAEDCCNKCGSTFGCRGFAFLTGTNVCWLKTSNPLQSSNFITFTGMIIGQLTFGG